MQKKAKQRSEEADETVRCEEEPEGAEDEEGGSR